MNGGDYYLKKRNFLKKTGVISVFIITAFSALYLNFPSDIVLPENSNATLLNIPLCSVSKESDNVYDEEIVKNKSQYLDVETKGVGNFSYNLKLFDVIPVKNLRVEVVPKRYVIPSGEAVGVKMYTDGLLVVCVSSVVTNDGRCVYPARDAGILEGDRILSVDGIEIKSNEEFSDYINKVKKSITVKVMREDECFEVNILPWASNDDGKFKIGLWVRDSTAGIGTMTYYEPETNNYAALGHAITDSDTGSILKVSNGMITGCSIISVKKGERGAPGELCGSFSNINVGSIKDNNEFGIYGKIFTNKLMMSSKLMETARRFQIKEGEASILCDVDGEGVKEYSVEILSVSKKDAVDNKGIVIKVTDEELIKKTGGIVQGMSGSPIIQNGKLVGAVTHVFVNDPTRGYGIFIENMLAETWEIR